MRDKIAAYLKAGYSGLFVQSFEEVRVQSELRFALKSITSTAYHLHVWTCTKGIASIEDGQATIIENTQDPGDALNEFDKMKGADEGHVLLMQDFHLYVAEPNPFLIRRLKESLSLGKANSRCIIILGCQLKLVPELEKEFTVIEFKLPDREQLRTVLGSIAKSADIELNGNTDGVLDAASGLTCVEAENAFALSVVEVKDIDAQVVAREKASTLKKNGILEIVETALTLDDIGGLDLWKEHLKLISRCFTKEAKDYGLPSPRPVICCGQPGTAKSMSAMACKNVFGLPLLRLEAGCLFGSLVGESERNWRTAFATAKAIAPAILWIDEAEGLFSGAESSGKTDGGTTNRVIKAILQDMQFNGEGLFFIFTSNDIDQFPDPLIDRCDVWSFELPTLTERESIWKIHIAKRGRKPKKYDISNLAEKSEGYSGRQIEQVWLKAMMMAFNGGREPTDADVGTALGLFVPTSITMADAIEKRRKRLANRASPASHKSAQRADDGVRKISA
jgi:AAA+ superfamily predicted ATPase